MKIAQATATAHEVTARIKGSVQFVRWWIGICVGSSIASAIFAGWGMYLLTKNDPVTQRQAELIGFGAYYEKIYSVANQRERKLLLQLGQRNAPEQ